MKRTAKIGVIAAAVLAAAAAAWVLSAPGASGAEASDAPGENEEQIAAIEARPGTITITVEGPSVVEPFRVQDIRSTVSGTIMEAAEEGMSVARDDVLARFDDTLLRSALRQAELNLQQARLDLRRASLEQEKADGNLAEQENLFAEGSVTRDQRDTARLAAADAELNVESAGIRVSQNELSLQSAREALENARVLAPWAGVVLESSVTAGDVVNSGTILMRFADVSRLRLKAEVDEFDIGKVTEGMPVRVSADSLGENSINSTVEKISPAAEIINNISIFTVSTVLRNDGGVLRPGMSADVSILVSDDAGLIVPSSAVSSVRGRYYLDLYENEEIVTRRVSAGADDGSNTVITEGLEEGELVVIPQTAGFTLSTGGAASSGSSIIPIQVPGSGGSR